LVDCVRPWCLPLLIALVLTTLPLATALPGVPLESVLDETLDRLDRIDPQGFQEILMDPLMDLVKDPMSGDIQMIVGMRMLPDEGLAGLLAPFEGETIRIDERLGFAVVTVPEIHAEAFLLAAREAPWVDYAKPDGYLELHGTFTPNDPFYDQQWGPGAIGMEEAWATTLGDHNITVAVVDTGVAYDHVDLAGNVCVLGPDFGLGDDDPYDSYGHGTHIAGTVAAAIDNNEGVAGMGNVCIMAVKIEAHGGLTWSAAASGLQWSADNGANVIQIAWGVGTDPGAPLSTAVQNVHNAGVLMIASAGNSGCDADTVVYPAAYPQIMAVASLQPPGDQRSLFSSCGPAVEIAAPGSDIYSTLPVSVHPDGYGYASGTSMAAPHVSGIAALVWSEHQELDASTLRCALAQHATPLEGEGRNIRTGFGRVDAADTIAGPTCLPAPPEAPVIIGRSGDGTAILSWHEPYSWGGVDGYHVLRGDEPDDLQPIATLNTTVFEDNQTQIGPTYYYAVRPYNEAGNGTISNTISVTPVTAITLPHTQDWQQGLGDWQADGLWGLTTDRAASGDHSAYFGVERGTTPEENHYDTGKREIGNLTSPPIDLRGLEQASLSFWSYHEMEGGFWEHPIIQVATSAAPEFQTVWSLHLDHQGPAALDLTPFVGQVIHLRFHVDTIDAIDNRYEGWYVDDLVISTDSMPQLDPWVEINWPGEQGYHAPSAPVLGIMQDPNGIQDIELVETRTALGGWKQADTFMFFFSSEYTNLTTGEHLLEVRVTDKGGNQAIAQRQLNVDAEPPTVAITSPPAGTQVECTLTVNGTAQDSLSGLSHVVLFEGGRFLGGASAQDPYQEWHWSIQAFLGQMGPGPFELEAVAVDRVGNHNTTSLQLERLEADCLPQVAITSHQDGDTMGCVVTISGTAQSGQGGAQLSHVIIMLGGQFLGSVSLFDETNTTWTLHAPSGRVGPGPFSLTATLYDQSWQSATSVPIQVEREGDCKPEITLSSPEDGDDVHCLLTVSGTYHSPYAAAGQMVVLQVGTQHSVRFLDDSSGSFNETFHLENIPAGGHQTIVYLADENGIWNQTQPFTINKQESLCRPVLSIDQPHEGDVIEGTIVVSGQATFPDEESGLPTQGTLEVFIDDLLVHQEALGTGPWSFEWDTREHENGPTRIDAILEVEGAGADRKDILVFIENSAWVDESLHEGTIGCSIGLLTGFVRDQCGGETQHHHPLSAGLTAARLELTWDDRLGPSQYLSLRLTIGNDAWHETAGPGDTSLIIQIEGHNGPLTSQGEEARLEVFAGHDDVVPALALMVDYHIEATWAYHGATIPS
jgi:thermitase